ncbi:hypothetical protein B0H13DRAFT_1633652 [Mycena leptocephala]|nr:hypothetical protein B0H13DRAFT_1633652 [Mycena leptocephala]
MHLHCPRSCFSKWQPFECRNCTLSVDEAPFLLCRICQSCRAIALTTPCLWASIHIVVPAGSKMPQLTERVTAWLGRSGTVPLGISLVFSRTIGSGEVGPIMSLVAVSRQWRNIQLTMRCYSYFESLLVDDVPLLENIAIRNHHTELQWSDPAGVLGFLATKSLRRVEFPSMLCALRSPISWGSITHSKILLGRDRGITYDNVLGILCQCPLLETCELSLRFPKNVAASIPQQ